MTDMRYWFSNPPVQVSIVTTNGWPTDMRLDTEYRIRKDWLARKARSEHIGLRGWLFGGVLIFPLVVWWFVNFKQKQKQNKSDKL